MLNIFGFIFIFILGILIGNITQTNLINGVALFFGGTILTIYLLYTYKKIGLFTLRDNQVKLVLLICLEIVGFIIGFIGLIHINNFRFDVGIMIFLVFFIFFIFIKELIGTFKRHKK